MHNIANRKHTVSEKVLITGAAGFIGSHVTEFFCEKGVKVYCLVKKSSNLQFIKHLPIRIIYGDITDPECLHSALKSMDCVIHIAALARDWGRYKDFYDVNVNGTMNVLEACKDNGIKDIIITGSNSSYGEEDSRKVKDETFPFNSNYRYFMDVVFPCRINYYRNTKALCTSEALKYAQKESLNITIIEPVWVYGEREFNTGFYEYMRAVKSKVPFLPGNRKNKFHVIYAKDLARAYYLAYSKKLAGINRILTGNQQADNMNRIYTLFCRELGIKKPVNIPKILIYPLGFFMELIYTVTLIKHPPILTRGRINMFYDNIEYSVKKAASLLSFKSEYRLEEGIKRTVKWYKEKHLI